MNELNSAELDAVLDRVQPWSPEMKFALAQQLLTTLGTAAVSTPPKTMSLDEIVGLLKTDSPPPDDEECARIIEEERLRKFG